MNWDNEVFTNPELEKIYFQIKRKVIQGKEPVLTPVSVVLGGLPGAGKGNIYGIYDERTNNNIVHIDCDKFRKFHPDAKNFSPEEYAEGTNKFVFAVSDRLVDELSLEKYNLISESSLKSPRTAFQHADNLKSLGYRVELAVMASSIETAWNGTIQRYNDAKAKYEYAVKIGKTDIDPPRPVNKDFFDLVAANIAGALDNVYKSTDSEGKSHNSVDDIYIFTRNRDIIYHMNETPSLNPAPILEARLHNTEISAYELINGYYNDNKFKYNTLTPITKFSSFGDASLNKMASDPRVYNNFLKYYGRIFKHNTTVALEFFSQKPDARFIATRDQWEKINRHVKKGGEAIRFVETDGSFTDYYDFSQIKEENPPNIWSIHKNNVDKLKKELNIKKQTSVITGVMQQTIKATDITSCMMNIGIHVNEYTSFRAAYLNAVQLIMAGRLEVGGNIFDIPVDNSAFVNLKNNNQRIDFIAAAAATAKKSLLKIEKSILNQTIQERMEKENENKLREMENNIRLQEGRDSGRRTTDRSERTPDEWNNRSSNGENKREIVMDGNSDNRNVIRNGFLSGIQDENNRGNGDMVQVRSDMRTVHDESDRRTEYRGTADRIVRNEMDEIHGGNLSGQSRVYEDETRLPDNSPSDRQRSDGIQRASGRTVRSGESTSNELRRNSEMGTGKNVLFEQYGNERESSGSDIRRIDIKAASTNTDDAVSLFSDNNDRSFSSQINAALNGSLSPYESIKVCDTPQILQRIGCDPLPMLYTQRHLKDALHPKSNDNSHYHGLTVEQLTQIPALLEEPAIIFDSLSPSKNGKTSIVVVLNAIDNDNAPLIVSVLPNGQGVYQLEKIDANFITSIYGKDNGFEQYINRAAATDSILYIDKIKSQELFSCLGLQLSKAINNLDSNIIIHQSSNIVNLNLKENGTLLAAKPQNRELTRAEMLYNQFNELYPEITSKTHLSEQYSSTDDAEQLEVKAIGTDTYSFMTFYFQNSNLIRDPEFIFSLDTEKQTLNIIEYHQDNIPTIGAVNLSVIDENENKDILLLASLEKNLKNNFDVARQMERTLIAYTDILGKHDLNVQSEITNDNEFTNVTEKQEDKTPELRAVLNRFSGKHELGEINISYRSGTYWSVNEKMKDGSEFKLGEITHPDLETGKPFTPEELQTALEKFETDTETRNIDISNLYGRQGIININGGITTLPATRDNLPIISYESRPYEKISDNISAIREMIRLETAIEYGHQLYEKREGLYNSKSASDKRLRKYSGWGGVPQFFDEQYHQFEHFRKIMKENVSSEEYSDARASTLNSHYTPQIVIDAMYKAIQNMNLPRNAHILEPSCGTGNFISRIPHSLGDVSVTGIELDSITARIAAQIFRDNNNVQIIHSAFERTQLENNSFDLVIGNVPFGDYNMNDPDYIQDWKIHDAFFRRAIDKVAAGGVVAFITSSGTLDKKSPKVREYLAMQADLIGAIRLPNNAFSSAGTKVTSDIIFLQKRNVPLLSHEPKPDWCYVVPNEDNLHINSYFVENPQMVLGKMEKTTHFNMLTCTPFKNANLEQQLEHAIHSLNATITTKARAKAQNDKHNNIEPWGNNFSYHVKDGNIYFRENNEMIKLSLNKKETEKFKSLIEMRTATREIIELQKTEISDAELSLYRNNLNKIYNRYFNEYGSIAETGKSFSEDIDYPILRALEVSNNGKYIKADIFTQRTVSPISEVNAVSTAEEALQVSLDRKGNPDIIYMASLIRNNYTGMSINDVAKALCNELLDKELIYIDPEKVIPGKAYSGIVEQSEYLSGNVRMKLTLADEISNVNQEYKRNVIALRNVIPEDIKAEEITVNMGCTWIDAKDYTEFLHHLSGRSNRNSRVCDVSYSPVSGEFTIMNAGSTKDLNINETTSFGTGALSLYKIAEKILNQRRIDVKTKKPDPKNPSQTITRTDAKATRLALEKAKIIRDEFKKWIFSDPERKNKYERKYNNIFNSLVGRKYDGSKLSFPGMLNNFTLRSHQKDCVLRAIHGNTLAAHVVGAGKSAIIISTVMKKKQLGLINKAFVVVPKALTEQTANEWRNLYPDAKILTVTEQDLKTEKKRNLFTAKVATGAYAAVIMSQEQYEKMPMSVAYQKNFIQAQIDQLEDILSEEKYQSSGKKTLSIKDIESSKKRLNNKLDKLLNPKSKSKSKDKLLEFEELGFDYLVCDEAHAYKNGFVITKMSNVAGVTTRPSGRAEDMQMKTDYFNENFGNGHILFATGTPNATP